MCDPALPDPNAQNFSARCFSGRCAGWRTQFRVIVTFNAQRSDCDFFFILGANSTVLRIASARDGRSA